MASSTGASVSAEGAGPGRKKIGRMLVLFRSLFHTHKVAVGVLPTRDLVFCVVVAF